MELALNPDLAIVKAWKGDARGNLVFRGTSQNSNSDCAKAGKFVIAEVEEMVEVGELNVDEIHLPGIYVDKIIKSTNRENRIERLREASTTKKDGDDISVSTERIIKRATKELKNGMYVNLGIGLPTMVSNYIPPEISIEIHAENGLLGVGPYPQVGCADPDFLNAGKETVTALPGSSAFSSSESFSIVRGGHLDLTMLGGLQCSSRGDLANWIIPGKMVKGMGGAMDLVSAKSRVIVIMDHITKDGSHKIVPQCTLPLTGKGVVDRIITDMCVFDCDKNGENGGGLTLIEIAPGLSVDDIQKATGCKFKVASNDIPSMLDSE